MTRTRSLAGFLLIVVTLGLVSTGLVTSPASAAAQKLIQGVVVDQAGRPVDDVKVQALDAEGVVVATALSYASQWEDGPQHGYFFLVVPRGTYSVTLAKAGYVATGVEDVTITRKHPRASLGEVAVEKKAVETKTVATLPEATVLTTERVKVDIKVTTDGETPFGEVVVKFGKKELGSADLKRSDKGKVTVGLGKFPFKGTYDLKAYFSGSSFHKASESAKVTLTVKRPKRNRVLPNALAYVG